MRKESYQESGVKSLAGRIDKLAMGSSVFRDKPKKTPVQQRSTDSTYKPNSFK